MYLIVDLVDEERSEKLKVKFYDRGDPRIVPGRTPDRVSLWKRSAMSKPVGDHEEPVGDEPSATGRARTRDTRGASAKSEANFMMKD